MWKSRTRQPHAADPREDDGPTTTGEPVAAVTSQAPDAAAEPATKPAADAPTKPAAEPAPARRRMRDWTPLLLLRATHPRQAILTALALGVAAALDGRPARELVLVVATVLVGQAVLGWHNDIVDKRADAAHKRPGKPIGDGRLDTSTAWFALCCGVLLVVPLAVSNGTRAGIAYLVSLAVGMVGNVGNVVLRRGVFSFVPWAIAFALYPFFLSYGGWGGGTHGGSPQWALVGLSAALGIGVHVLLALWGLVADNEDGWTYLPLRLGLRLGATRLLVFVSVYCVVVVAALLYLAQRDGLTRPG